MLDNVHKELSAQGGDRKQQKPWGRNPGFHLLVLISELWFEELSSHLLSAVR